MKTFNEYLKENQNIFPNTRGKSGPTMVKVTQDMSGYLTGELQAVLEQCISFLKNAEQYASEGDEASARRSLDGFFHHLPELQRLYNFIPK